MKLIDLLVKELPERGGWPNGVDAVEQDGDGRLFEMGSDYCSDFNLKKCDDWLEVVVTKKQYESALAASEGWIDWYGGKCPVDSDAIVEVKYRKPSPYQFNNDRAGDFTWSHDGFGGDIIAYRLHRDINHLANDDRLEQDLNECIGQGVDVPAWNGEGLPPVGAKVEFFINPKLGYRNDWIPDVGNEMEVVAHKTTTDGNDVAVCYWDDGGAGRSCCFVPESLKPLRTEAEKKRDEAGFALYHAINWNAEGEMVSPSRMEDYKKAYDAIAAGKIPGVKLEGK